MTLYGAKRGNHGTYQARLPEFIAVGSRDDSLTPGDRR